jgi:hypothetical protein
MDDTTPPDEGSTDGSAVDRGTDRGADHAGFDVEDLIETMGAASIPAAVAADAAFLQEVTVEDVMAAVATVPGATTVVDDEGLVLVGTADPGGAGGVTVPALPIDPETVVAVSSGTGPAGPFVMFSLDEPGVTVVITPGDLAVTPEDLDRFIDEYLVDDDEPDEERLEALQEQLGELAYVPALATWTGTVRMVEAIEEFDPTVDDPEATWADLVSTWCCLIGFGDVGIDVEPLADRLEAASTRFDEV